MVGGVGDVGNSERQSNKELENHPFEKDMSYSNC